MFRFTIRDVLWLTVVVALAVGWFVTNSRLSDSKNDMKYVEFWLLEANNPDAFGHLQQNSLHTAILSSRSCSASSGCRNSMASAAWRSPDANSDRLTSGRGIERCLRNSAFACRK